MKGAQPVLIPFDINIEIGNELTRQKRLKAEGKFDFTCADPETSDILAAVILGEEFGEVCREVMAAAGLVKEHSTPGKLRKELIQVVAVSIAWIQKLDRIDNKP